MAKNIFVLKNFFILRNFDVLHESFDFYITFATQRHLPAESTRLQQIIDRFSDTDSPNRDDYRIEAH
jgi:hypothetical protein